MKLSSTLSSLVVVLTVCVDGCDAGRGREPGVGVALATYDPSAGSTLGTSQPSDVASQPATYSGAEPGRPAPKSYMVTTGGVMLGYPVWLEQHPDQKAALLEGPTRGSPRPCAACPPGRR